MDLVEEYQRREDKKGKEKEKKRALNPEVEMFKRSELLEKYTAKILFGWNNRKFEDKYLKKLDEMERERKTSFSRGKTLKQRYYYSMLKFYFIF